MCAGEFTDPVDRVLAKVGDDIERYSTYTLDTLNDKVDAFTKLVTGLLSNLGVINRIQFPGNNPFGGTGNNLFKNLVLCWNGNTALATEAAQLPAVAAGVVLKKDLVPKRSLALSTHGITVCRFDWVRCLFFRVSQTPRCLR